MNTKKFFMLLAAVLLGSVSAMAQSGNNSPLVGDVNGDIKVDVADITAVIKIIKNTQEHYFYLGTIEPTAENYKIIPGATTSYTSFDEAVGTTVSVDAGQTLYMLCPAEWVKGKTVTLEDNSGETLNFSEEIDYTTISGYAIYKTQVLTDAKDVTLKVAKPLYWYVGTNPITTSSTPGSGTVSAMDASTTLGWHNITGTPTQIQVGSTPRQSSNVTWYIAIPNSLGITKATSGGLTDGTVTSTTMTLSDGVVYRVFTTSQAEKINYLMTK